MALTDPKTHLGLAGAAVVLGGVAFLLGLLRGVVGYVVLLPWLLGAVGLYYGVRAQSLPMTPREEIEDRGRHALHFSILSMSITAAFLVIVAMSHFLTSSP
jgi:hypothetical protein